MNKRKSKTDRAARRKATLPHMQAMIEPPSIDSSPVEASPASAADARPSSTDTDEFALARLADDGGPPPPESDRQVPSPMPAAVVPPAPPAIVVPPIATVAPPAATLLEQRVRRLEDALAQLQEHRGIETRIVAHPPAPPPVAPPPVAADATMALLDAGKRWLGAAANAVTQSPPLPAAAPPSAAPPVASSGILWLLWDTWAEARAIVRMFVDPRYRLPWSSRIIPLVLLALILTSRYWIPGSSIPLLGDWLLVKLVDLVLAFLLFKWLGHEARRYRQTSPDLPPTLRL